MDFNELSFEELDQKSVENLVFDDAEISPILKGHIFIEKILETLISNNLPNPDVLFRRRHSFEFKIDLASAMGLLGEKHVSSFKAINNIRNNYSHVHDYKVTIEELSGFKFDWEEIQNKAFEVCCEKGSGEAARIATIFLCWKAIRLISEPEEE